MLSHEAWHVRLELHSVQFYLCIDFNNGHKAASLKYIKSNNKLKSINLSVNVYISKSVAKKNYPRPHEEETFETVKETCAPVCDTR